MYDNRHRSRASIYGHTDLLQPARLGDISGDGHGITGGSVRASGGVGRSGGCSKGHIPAVQPDP
jgi:hypothetical protein